MSRTLCALALAGAGAAAPAQAEVVLGSIELFFGFGAQSTLPTMTMGFGMIADQGTSNPADRLFAVDQTLISASDVGATWVTDSATAAAIRAHLADDDRIDALGFYAYTGTNDVTGRVEEADFGDRLDLDLIAQMDEMRVTLLMWQPIPGHKPTWTDYLFRVRYEFVSIPAPGATAALGAAGLLAVRRRRR